jgi:hypothetical protein
MKVDSFPSLVHKTENIIFSTKLNIDDKLEDCKMKNFQKTIKIRQDETNKMPRGITFIIWANRDNFTRFHNLQTHDPGLCQELRLRIMG